MDLPYVLLDYFNCVCVLQGYCRRILIHNSLSLVSYSEIVNMLRCPDYNVVLLVNESYCWVLHCCSDETHDSLTIMTTQHEDTRHHQQKEAEEICLRLSMGLSFNPSQHHISSTPRSSSSQRTSFSIIIPAGQDTSLVYIGWTTQYFKYYPELFQKLPSGSNNSMVGCQGIKLIDSSGTEVECVTGYMMCLAELFKNSHLTRLDSNSDHVSSDYLIGCIVDQQAATISYTVNKEHISNCDIKACTVHMCYHVITMFVTLDWSLC